MEEYAFGIIPIHKGEHGLEVFLIYQYGSGGDMLWTFPKGHAENGELPIETALRECKEEAGLIPTLVDEQNPFSISYSFERKGVQVDKTSTYYIGFVSNTDFKIQEDEVLEAAWVPISEVHNRLTFPYTKKLFDSVLEHLDNLS